MKCHRSQNQSWDPAMTYEVDLKTRHDPEFRSWRLALWEPSIRNTLSSEA